MLVAVRTWDQWWAQPTLRKVKRRLAEYRRWRVAGGTYFFTVVTSNRLAIFDNDLARSILGQKIRLCRQRWPFMVDAIVLLPDHLHCIWTLPPRDAESSRRWAWIKKEFTKEWLKSGGTECNIGQARMERGDRGVWQPRYWEHTIRDEHDFERHFDYVHYNPVKHGHAVCPGQWAASSFCRWVRAGVYEPEWGCTGTGQLSFDDLDKTAMELE